jgi:hypothetical protein
VFLMASKKRPKNKTSNYLISMGESLLRCCAISLLLSTHAHTEHTCRPFTQTRATCCARAGTTWASCAATSWARSSRCSTTATTRATRTRRRGPAEVSRLFIPVRCVCRLINELCVYSCPLQATPCAASWAPSCTRPTCWAPAGLARCRLRCQVPHWLAVPPLR